MAVLSVIIALVFLILGWFLFASLKLYIDTSEKQYYVQFKGLVSAHLIPTKDFFLIKLKVPFYTFSIDPLKMNKPSKKALKQPENKSVIKKKKGKSWSATFTFLRSIMATFKIKHFILDLDTGNYPLNAQLVPVFTLMSRRTTSLKTNFMGKSYFSIVVENRLIRMMKPTFKYLISK